MGLVRRDRDENFHGGGMNEKLRRDAGLKKPMLDPQLYMPLALVGYEMII